MADGHTRRASRGGAVAGAALALASVLGACDLPPGALDGPMTPVSLRVEATSTSVEIDAPGWFAETSAVYLCSAEPPPLPEPGPDRVGWTPGPACHDYGRYASRKGLTASLALTDLAGPAWAPFAAAQDWYVLIVDIRGDRVSIAIRSRFAAPDDVAAF